ncbi:hypothetical protein BD311DRAFT_807461 [Dichomitus squalens]|uniref:Uncharacterized protein n=1 Tax=Dichomitus squalens TaxID=114155 RepID=A0A4Q9MNR6_9APHY|nr:hypothetical protein BD311DRAFT_807461 [Dichomitus squalens]
MATNGTSIVSLFPQVPTLDNTLGAVLIGTFIGLMMHGLSLHQTFRYFRIYVGDTLLLKLTVFGLAVLDTTHSVACMHASYFYLVTNYFNPLALFSGIWSIRSLAPLTGATVLLAQSFYVRRVYLLGQGYALLVIPLGLIMIGTTGFAVAASFEIFHQKTFANFERFTWLMSGGFGCSLATDILLTVALTIFLTRSRSAFHGALSLLSLVFGVTQPGNMIYIAANMLATKSYVNAVLAVVNSRRSLADSIRDTEALGTFGLSTQLQSSQRLPMRVEHFRTALSQGDAIDVHWRIPAQAEDQKDGGTGSTTV